MRLKESVIEFERKKYGRDPTKDSEKDVAEVQGDQLLWQYFDEKSYIDQTQIRPGQDAYAKNKFNQAASDRMKSNRDIPDTRHPR